MKIKLLALDLDGTLVDRNGEMPPERRAAVMRARAAGVAAVIVTGRSWRAAKRYYYELAMTGPAICYLGALVLKDGTGLIQHYRPLVTEAWEVLREFAVGEGLAVTACLGTDLAVAEGELPATGLMAADTAYATCPAADFADWEGWNTYTQMTPDLSACKAPPIMVAVYGAKAVGRVLQRFPQGLPQSQFDLSDQIAGETVLHIWHAKADKGLALARFCRSRGIAPEEVAAFGDAPMDLSMVKFAGVGVAMPSGHPDLQAAADWVAEPEEAIERLLQGEFPHSGSAGFGPRG